MNPRIENLLRKSKNAPVTISDERARLITRFYQSGTAQHEPVVIQRALAFRYIMEHKSICILPGELIVGERGPAPKAVPTYPEICLHSIHDLQTLDQRSKVPYKVPPETFEVYANQIIPFWSGRTMRERVFAHMSPEWMRAYQAGVFTEFQEQRCPGHTAMGDKIYRKGFLDLNTEIERAESNLDYFNDPEALEKAEQLRAMRICIEALIHFARRHADALDAAAAEESEPNRKSELVQMARICRKVPASKPETFWEALQMYWFVHVGVITELNPWDAFNPGRLDQHLSPFYQQEIQNGSLTREKARELLQAFWIKFNNHPAPPKVGVTAQESNTYVDFALINLGGLTSDNRDGVCELSYLLLDVIEEMRLLQPSSMVQISKKNPDRFLKRAIEIIRTGYGQPSVFNTDTIVQALVRQGKDIRDARCGGASGCVEMGAFGKEAYFLTGYFNLPKILELTLHHGFDRRTGQQVGTGLHHPETFTSYEKLFDAFSSELAYFAKVKIRGNNIIEKLYARYLPVPFLSLLIDDCIQNAKDYNAGGARYNTSYIQGVGLGSTVDALSAVRTHVFEKKNLSIHELIQALDDNFEGRQKLQEILLHHSPKWGNADPTADETAVEIFNAFFRAVEAKPNTRNGMHRINLLPTTCHVYFGSVTGALPDGRKAGQPLSEGISPVQGMDRQGPTAVIHSASKLDHIRTGGTLLNQRFLPQVLADETGIKGLVHLIRSYFKMDGHHIQFNVIDCETLKKAQANPDDYRDLIVRVAGYSDYFVDLTPELQEEIIQRTAHQKF